MVAKKDDKKMYWFPAKKYGFGWGLPTVWQGWATLLLFLCIGVTPVVYAFNIYEGDARCKWVTSSGIASGCDPSGFKGLYMVAASMWLIAALLLLYMVLSKKGEVVKRPRKVSKKGAKHAAKS